MSKFSKCRTVGCPREELLLAAAYAANFEVPDIVRVATQVVLVALGGASSTRRC